MYVQAQITNYRYDGIYCQWLYLAVATLLYCY